MDKRNRRIMIGTVLVAAVILLAIFQPWRSRLERVTQLVVESEESLTGLAQKVIENEGMVGLRVAGVQDITYQADTGSVKFACSEGHGFYYSPGGEPRDDGHRTEIIKDDWYYYEG